MNELKINIKSWFLQNLFIIAGVCLTIANLYLATKLSPILASVSNLANKVEAVSERLEEHEADNNKIHATISTSFADFLKIEAEHYNVLNTRLSRIEGALGRQ